MSPPDQGFHDILPMDSHSSLLTVSADEAQRKVVVLGIPWQTEDETLQRHFSKFGPIEVAQIMREKFSGKSRGFGFVTFVSTVDAATAVGSDHEIDGRRCEAKYALPEGRVGSARTTRIFVARIPSSVTDAQFRGYFEQFGPVQDAYMPKDPSKSGHRGIGFVTYATPESVEIVMASSHTLNGNEIAIDRATPKDTKGASGLLPGRLSMSHPNLSMLGGTSFTGGNAVFSSPSRPIGLPGSGVRYEPSQLGMGNRRMSFPVLANNNTTGNGAVSGSPPNPHAEVLSSHYQHPSAPLLNSLGQRYGNANASGSNININLLAAQAQMQAAALSGNNTFEPGSSPSQLMSILNANARMVSSLRSAGSLSHLTGGSAASSSSDLTAILAQHQQNQQEQWPAMKSMGSSGALASSAMGPASARAGPRIFVGKLNRETTEFDVKEYFIQFGYVMDVYLPRDKHNKREHRGFGFVTFETEASVQRVVAHGPHQIRGSIVAIDSAVPRQEEITVVMDSKTSSSSSMPPAFVPLSMAETEAQALQAMGALGLDGVVDHENKNGAEHHY